MVCKNNVEDRWWTGVDPKGYPLGRPTLSSAPGERRLLYAPRLPTSPMPNRNARHNGPQTGPTWEQMSQELADVGVPEDHARMYVQLVRRGPSTATELAEILRISRPQAYRLLEALTHDAFVTPSLGRPRTFAAAEPSSVLQALRERTQRSLEHIDRVQGLLATRLASLRKQADDSDMGPQFAVLRGVDALAKTAQDVCRLADERIDVLVGQDASAQIFEAVVHQGILSNKAREGVQVRVLAPPQARIASASLERRHLDQPPLVTLVLADEADALMALTAPARGRGQESTLGVRSNAMPFVASQRLLFDALWGRSP